MSILVLIPTDPKMGAELCYRSYEAERCMKEACGHIDVVRDFRDGGVEAGVRGICGRTVAEAVADMGRRIPAMAALRNALIEAYLGDQHSHVMWIDADVVVYDPLLPGKLVQRDSGAVIAPMVKTQGVKDRLHDLAGFVRGGKWAREFPPWWDGVETGCGGGLVEMDCVGTCYLVPADVYRKGGRYGHIEGYTEHMSVCRRAKELGYRVEVDMGLSVFHVNDCGGSGVRAHRNRSEPVRYSMRVCDDGDGHTDAWMDEDVDGEFIKYKGH